MARAVAPLCTRALPGKRRPVVTLSLRTGSTRERLRGSLKAVISDSLGKRRLPGAGDVWQTSRGGRTAVELSTFGHFAARTANTGERGESKITGQGACVLPAAAQLPGPFAAKCPKVAITFALDGEVSVSLGAPVLVRAAPQREVRPHTLRLDTLVRGRGKRIEKLLAISLAHESRIRQHEHARVA